MECEFRVLGEKGNRFGLRAGYKKSLFHLVDKYITRFDSSFVYGHKCIYDRAFFCCLRNFCGLQ